MPNLPSSRFHSDEIARLFDPLIEAAVSSIRNQATLSGGLVKSVLLVGGSAPPPWFVSQLQEQLAPDGIAVLQLSGGNTVSVATGAVGFHCEHYVTIRIAKCVYGVEFLRVFDARNPEHKKRESLLVQAPSGQKLLPGAFDCIFSRVRSSMKFTLA